ncbi:riboflavin synthase [Tamilnaduibacter salinus]|uniref:Riboflavin synthase n=1 Tax=Tamilnaduibacter salinus TaxID=1484056 RepID=A0A2A2I5Z3_9GAMM|nr:riboflavin synthase subunit alpha [Tamilnaduibacter salinus]PAV27431.1 riboflavin synthase [Tamilnaduibacter salinus]
MFTGIIQELARVEHIERQTGLSRFRLRFPPEHLDAVQTGASVSIDGVCLTVTNQEGDCLFFDAMQETLRLTHLGDLNTGDVVNFERAARIGDEIGGHLLSGHVHTTAEVIAIDTPENNRTITFRVPDDWCRYLFPKGYIAINGASLTIGDVVDDTFNVHLIPETLRVTTFANLSVGDRVNVEIDSQTQTVVDTIERMGLRPR